MRKRRIYHASIAVIVAITAFSVVSKVMRIKTCFVGDMLFPLQKIVSGTERELVDITKYFTEYDEVKKENERLRAELNDALETVAELYSLEEENAVLKDRLSINENSPGLELTEASLIASGTGLQIDKGKEDGIKEYTALMTTGGLVGFIVYCGDNWSNMTLISSKNFTCGGCNPRTREKGIISGDGKNVYMTCLMTTTQTKEGDVIVTEDGRIPGGIVIGRVKRIYEEENGLSKTAEIESAVDINDVKRVYVVTGNDG